VLASLLLIAARFGPTRDDPPPGSAVGGALLGRARVKIPTGVFDWPPDVLAVRWSYLIIATVVGVVIVASKLVVREASTPLRAPRRLSLATTISTSRRSRRAERQYCSIRNPEPDHIS
jgi:hypothetical protein